MQLEGVNRVALTVTDLQRGRSWYERVLDWSSVFEGDGEVPRPTFLGQVRGGA